MPKLSPLNAWHESHNGKMVEFGGWQLPIQFSSVIQEHDAVRECAGIFDISHMAQFFVQGDSVLSWLQRILVNDVDVPPGRGIYSPMCNEKGGVIDDLYAFRLTSTRYFIVSNALREPQVTAWFTKRLQSDSAPDIAVHNRSDRGALAIQGPNSAVVLARLFPELPARKNFILECDYNAGQVLISRTGYTGEDGFELFTTSRAIPALWEAIWAAGCETGLQACGLGARDTLRLEMGYPLYGHELDEHTTPFDVGYGWSVKLNKSDFVGRDALQRAVEIGSKQKLIGLVIDGRGVPREQNPVFSGSNEVGVVTSGTHSPTLRKGICLAMIDSNSQGPYVVEIHGKKLDAIETRLPFYHHA